MKISEYQKLEDSIKEQDFNASFKNINKVMFFLSIFGHIASIFLAYFLISKILTGAITDNPLLVNIASVILLGGLELLKREIFDKFSLQQIKYKSFTNPDVLPLMIVSFLIVSISFYSSIKGAEEFSTKTKEIQTQVETNIKSYQDSLNSIKNIELSKINTKIESKESKIEEKDKELTELSNVDDLSKQQKIRIKDLKSQAQLLTQEINVLKSEKDTIEKRTQREILNHKANVESKGIEKKEENSDNSFFFVVISTIIELLILFGIYFNEYFKYRSYVDFKNKIETDSNFNSYHKFNSILNIIYSDDTKINDKLMTSKTILELCKVNGINVLQKDINNMFKLFSSLGIISKGSNKYYLKSKSIAQEVLKKHFNID
jgi:hypothetical protein